MNNDALYYLQSFDPDDDMTWQTNDDARDAAQSALFAHHVTDDDPTLILTPDDRAAFHARLPFEDFSPEDTDR